MDSTDKGNFPDTITHTIKVMHLTFKYALNSTCDYWYCDIDETTQETRLTGGKS